MTKGPRRLVLDQYLDMVQAKGLDDLIAAHRKHQGIPLFNTIAVIGVVSTLLGRNLVPKMSEYLYRNFGNLFYLKPITGDLKLYEKKN